MNLVIVESPTKARKLSAYLGKDFKIEASVGHVRDLPKKKLGIDLEKDFALTYEVDEEKTKVVKHLQTLAKKANKVYLAMDPDREGEAIAWHIRYLLKEAQKKQKTKVKAEFLRSTFHEITKRAVLKAIDKPGKIRMDLVDAQQARRVVDRLVGYKVSPVLWKKVRRGLSAGRVQSVALRLIVEREREIKAFKAKEYWEIDVALSVAEAEKSEIFKEGKAVENLPQDVLIVSLDKIKGKKFGDPVFTEKHAKPVVKDLKTAKYLVQDVERKERVRNSLPPFTTSLLQQNAASKFGFSARQTMRLAQQLYEEGLITYHRTDSFNLSQSAIKMARDFIQDQYGSQYLPSAPRIFKSRSKSAQEAHEAIRVTKVSLLTDEIRTKSKKFTERHLKLYALIWRRFLASQMKAAIYDQTTILVEAWPKGSKVGSSKTVPYLLKATGSIMKFDGWTKLFKNPGDKTLPACEVGQDLNYLDINPLQKYTQPPARYNDASLVKELEKRGIGRPSTYASIISVIQDRAYVEKTEKKFFATSVGITVSDFLLKNFSDIMDYDFTAEMEEDLDRIARGEKEWKNIVKIFWRPLAKIIHQVVEKAARVQIPVEKTGKPCPDCGKTDKGEIVIRTGRFGKFKSCSRYPDCKYSENLVEKLEGMTCPLCKKGEVIVKKTRWGKPFYGCSRYPDCDWASWKKPEKGETITQRKWEEIKRARQERAAKRKGKKGKWAKRKKKK
ncbi:MAG: type I DNA topoisomerase [Candidatus Woesebacteria bacterium]|jgi:DNA topoisomerase-1